MYCFYGLSTCFKYHLIIVFAILMKIIIPIIDIYYIHHYVFHLKQVITFTMQSLNAIVLALTHLISQMIIVFNDIKINSVINQFYSHFGCKTVLQGIFNNVIFFGTINKIISGRKPAIHQKLIIYMKITIIQLFLMIMKIHCMIQHMDSV